MKARDRRTKGRATDSLSKSARRNKVLAVAAKETTKLTQCELQFVPSTADRSILTSATKGYCVSIGVGATLDLSVVLP